MDTIPHLVTLNKGILFKLPNNPAELFILVAETIVYENSGFTIQLGAFKVFTLEQTFPRELTVDEPYYCGLAFFTQPVAGRDIHIVD